MPNDNSADEELKLAIEQAPKVFQLLAIVLVVQFPLAISNVGLFESSPKEVSQ